MPHALAMLAGYYERSLAVEYVILALMNEKLVRCQWSVVRCFFCAS